MFIASNGTPSFGASFAWPSEDTFTILTVPGAVLGEETVDWRVGRRRDVR
jgi:hypothetical protein